LRWHFHTQAEQRELLIAADDRQKTGPTLYNYLNWLQKGREAAELRRLLYVGVTRARCRVWLSGLGKVESYDEAGLGWPNSTSPLGILREALIDEVIEHAARSDGVLSDIESSAAALNSAGCNLWRLPSSWFSGQNSDEDANTLVPEPQALNPKESASVQSNGHFVERTVGVVVHRALELLSQREALPSGVDAAVRRGLQFGLIDNGLAGDALAAALINAEAMIAATLKDERGRWILKQHEAAHSELVLMSRERGGEAVQNVIDRTFIDQATGYRWLIDYKTSRPHEAETQQQFLAREAEHYLGQLKRYRTLIEAFDATATVIRTALYFPADSLWLCLEDDL
jgi:ATP-dependent exoDNAse (exonuclease V) beta subunit